MIFSSDNNDSDLSLMHNDLTPSNIIVKDGRIAGVVDWEMAGFFGWKMAAKVHLGIRTPKRENFAALDLPEDLLDDILFWNGLYGEELGE
jgi:aminoglycoside phosphotransferase